MSKDNLTPDGAHIAPDSVPVEMTAADIAPVASVEPEAIPLRWVRVTHHTPDHIATRYPYAAYGSNLSLEQMSRRCPTADIVGHGTLRGAKVIFAYHMGITEAEGASTPMGIYKMTAADVAAMDRCEGLTRYGQGGYERYLVTVEIKGEAVRCFTYVKRDNALEAPAEYYYQTCLRGYTDWNFNTRRLRHAREDARKNGKRRTYSSQYGFWSGKQSNIDWDNYRKGTASTGSITTDSFGGRWYQDSNGARRKVKDGKPMGKSHPAMVPSVPSYSDDMLGYDLEGSGTAASYQPKVSLVTGRELPSSKKARRDIKRAVENFKRKHGSKNGAATLDARWVVAGPDQTEFVNGKGERWLKGANGVWYRAKE